MEGQDTSTTLRREAQGGLEISVESPVPCDWAMWQLLDSLLPTGGFAHSYGLEAALQAGLIAGPSGLHHFIVSALENAAGQLLPFVHGAHENATRYLQCARKKGGAAESPGGHRVARGKNGREAVCRWVELDAVLHAMLANHVARRASVSQGTALLRVAAALFPESGLLAEMRLRARKQPVARPSNPVEAVRSQASERRQGSEEGSDTGPEGQPSGMASQAEQHSTQRSFVASQTWQPHMHHAPIFGTVCGLVGVDSLVAQRAYLFTTLRDVLSAATRLNVIGPLEAAVLQRKLTATAEAILDGAANKPVSWAHQTAPLLDIVQGGQDALFSRLFST